MKRTLFWASLFFLLIAISCWAKKVSTPPALKMERTIVEIHDKAALALDTYPGDLGINKRNIPLVIKKYLGSNSTGAVISFYQDLRADKELSSQLYENSLDYKLATKIQEHLDMSMESAKISTEKSKKAQAVLNRAAINYPVLFSDENPISMERYTNAQASYNKKYKSWEKAVIADLKKGDLADSLLSLNVYVWGVQEGDSSSDDGLAKLAWKSGPIASMLKTKWPQAVLICEARLVDVKSGKLYWNMEFAYGCSKGEKYIEQFIKDDARLFKRYTDCMVEWLADDLVLSLQGKEPKRSHDCVTEIDI